MVRSRRPSQPGLDVNISSLNNLDGNSREVDELRRVAEQLNCRVKVFPDLLSNFLMGA
jgi:hypothetical protein